MEPNPPNAGVADVRTADHSGIGLCRRRFPPIACLACESGHAGALRQADRGERADLICKGPVPAHVERRTLSQVRLERRSRPGERRAFGQGPITVRSRRPPLRAVWSVPVYRMTSLLSAWHPLVVHATGPSWDLLRQRVARSRCSLEGAAALDQAIDSLEQLLGPSWPRRQYERHGWWPGELNLLGFHVAALPQFLALVTRLLTAAQELTFSTVLQALKRGVTGDGWRHAMLQLEVARALRGPGTCITFEPAILGSSNRADLLVARPGGSSFLVETTTLARAKADLDREETSTMSFRPSRRWRFGTASTSPCA
jgi:hypothetical protein